MIVPISVRIVAKVRRLFVVSLCNFSETQKRRDSIKFPNMKVLYSVIVPANPQDGRNAIGG